MSRSTKNKPQTLAFISGVVFVLVILVIALFLPNPSDFQYTVFRIILAVATAGFASQIPGILHVKIPKVLTASGALAVFVVVYFYSPAKLVLQHNKITGELTPRDKDSASADFDLFRFERDGVLRFRFPFDRAWFPLGPNVPFWIVQSHKGLLINAEVRSMDGKIVAELLKNEWRVNPNNYFKLNYDKSGLEIIDEYNIPWLQVDFLTPTSLKVGGVFRGDSAVTSNNFPSLTVPSIKGCALVKVQKGTLAIVANGTIRTITSMVLEGEPQRGEFIAQVRENVKPMFDYTPSRGFGTRSVGK